MGYHLARREIPFAIVDEGPKAGHAWRSRWDSLTLFTQSQYDGLPGKPFPAGDDVYPGRRSLRTRRERAADPSSRGDRGGRAVLPRTDVAVDARVGAAGLGRAGRCLPRRSDRRVLRSLSRPPNEEDDTCVRRVGPRSGSRPGPAPAATGSDEGAVPIDAIATSLPGSGGKHGWGRLADGRTGTSRLVCPWFSRRPRARGGPEEGER